MNKLFDSLIQGAEKNELTFVLCFYEELKKADFDPISIEIQFNRIVDKLGLERKGETNSFLHNLLKVFPAIDFDVESNMIRLLPHDYTRVIEDIEKTLPLIKEKINTPDSLGMEATEKPSNEMANLVKVLHDMYVGAPEGAQMSMIHLFGIMFSDQLANYSVKKIVIDALGKESLWIEVRKGMNLSKYVKIKDENAVYFSKIGPVLKKTQNQNLTVQNQNLSPNIPASFQIDFLPKELELLSKFNISIKANERNYKYSFIDRKENRISGGASPTFFKCSDFEWEGLTWEALLESFSVWFLKQCNKSVDFLLSIIQDWSKQPVFSKEQHPHFIGPLKHGLFINGNNSSLQMWWQILALTEILGPSYANQTYILIHYPSAVEPQAITKLLLKKELMAFKKYLAGKGFNVLQVKTHIENTKTLNTIYKSNYPNHYLFLIDRKEDFIVAISRIRKDSLFTKREKKLGATLAEISNFKNLLMYKDLPPVK